MTDVLEALGRFMGAGRLAQAAVDQLVIARAACGPQLRKCRICGEPLQWREDEFDGRHFPDPVEPFL